MTTQDSTLTIHMAASLDGFIAARDGGIEWMRTNDSYENGRAGPDEDEIAAFLRTIDCYLMGSRTYEHALELGWPYGDTPVVVLTRRPLPAIRDSVGFLAGDTAALVAGLKRKYRNIWLVGGAMLTREAIRLGLADEIRMMVMPVLLGGGTPFFDNVGRRLPLHLKEVNAYNNGLVELWYAIVKNGEPEQRPHAGPHS